MIVILTIIELKLSDFAMTSVHQWMFWATIDQKLLECWRYPLPACLQARDTSKRNDVKCSIVETMADADTGPIAARRPFLERLA